MSSPNSHQSQPRAASRRLRRAAILVVAVLILAILSSALIQRRYFGLERNLEQARAALANDRFFDAENLSRSILERHPVHVDALLILAEALRHQKRIMEAIRTYQRVPLDSGDKAIVAQRSLAMIYLDRIQLTEAENALRWIGNQDCETTRDDGAWMTLLSLSGQKWELLPFLRGSDWTHENRFQKLVSLADPDEMSAPAAETFTKMLQLHDPLAELGCARIFAANERSEQSIALIRHCLTLRPDLVEAQAVLGQFLLNSGRLDLFDAWIDDLPVIADDHPTIWFLRGRRSQDSGRPQEALRCYWETLRRQPNHDRATYQLGQLLPAENRVNESQIFVGRAKNLARFVELVRLIELAARLNGGLDRVPAVEEQLIECARCAFHLGRLRECGLWCEEIQLRFPQNIAAAELLAQLNRISQTDLPWLDPTSDLAARIDLSSLPLPKRRNSKNDPQIEAARSKTDREQISFVDDALRVGLQFTYFNGDDRLTEGRRMIEQPGGGVAAFDFDHDGWCDLYFTQGNAWPAESRAALHFDRLYRNLQGQQMRDVTSSTGIRDAGFGHGVSAGDYDNDGFTDLYVANLDGNRLYHNQGDGSFLDVTENSGLGKHPHWTTSCLLADLNGDSLPDVFDVTYLEGDDVFTRICGGANLKPRACSPSVFAAAPDHVFVNRGDGSFLEVTHEWGFDAAYGDGLGIVAADFDNSGRIGVFVANDGRANFFFVPDSTQNDDAHWAEMGVVSGLAYDDAGAAQASMGIAAGDLNNDGVEDLFVTNFYNESNTAYINLGLFKFSDRSRALGLREPSWSMLGFGAQCVDSNRDGWEDLVLVNGHVDDFTDQSIPYRMRPQFFENRRSRFVELPGSEIGSFFNEPKLGRGMARLDWNRDGLNDVVISHLDTPAALLTNRTRNAGNGISLKLVATRKSRDAIGTRVVVNANGMEITRQLVGGDGYLATNERRLDFGLAAFQGDITVTIHWMSQIVETFSPIPSNGEYLAIEGHGILLPMKSD